MSGLQRLNRLMRLNRFPADGFPDPQRPSKSRCLTVSVSRSVFLWRRRENGGSDWCVGADRCHGDAGHRVQRAGCSASAGDRLLWTAAGV